MKEREISDNKGKRILGWVLFSWGALGILTDLMLVGILQLASPTSMFPRLLVAGLLVWGGWRFSHPHHEKVL